MAAPLVGARAALVDSARVGGPSSTADLVVRPRADTHACVGPLILPNAWDIASAEALVDAGFTVIGTTSLGVATASAANGLPDAAGLALRETLELAGKLVQLPVPITVDIRSRHGADPRELAAQLWKLCAVGVNIEGGRGDHLADPSSRPTAARVRGRRAHHIRQRSHRHLLARPTNRSRSIERCATPAPTGCSFLTWSTTVASPPSWPPSCCR